MVHACNVKYYIRLTDSLNECAVNARDECFIARIECNGILVLCCVVLYIPSIPHNETPKGPKMHAYTQAKAKE